MSRPTNQEAVDRRLTKAFAGLTSSIEDHAKVHGKDSPLRLTVREMNFANLIASEGYTQSDAYVEAFEPQNASQDSITQMASRMAARTRVKTEIERIKRSLSEESLAREKRLAVALDGRAAYDKIAITLVAMITSPTIDDGNRIKAIKLFGDMKHIDAFAKSSTVINPTTNVNTLIIPQDASADEAKKALIQAAKYFLPDPQAGEVIDAEIVSYEKEKAE